MFVGVFKVAFAIQKTDLPDGRAVKGFCEKLMKRFKVVARSNYSEKKSGILWIAMSTIADKETTIQAMFEQILEMSDSSELGRVYSETGVIEPLEELLEDDDDVEHEYEP